MLGREVYENFPAMWGNAELVCTSRTNFIVHALIQANSRFQVWDQGCPV